MVCFRACDCLLVPMCISDVEEGYLFSGALQGGFFCQSTVSSLSVDRYVHQRSGLSHDMLE